MAWYDKNKVPQWKVFIEKNYSIESLLYNKDMILTELMKTEQLQQYINKHRYTIIQDCLSMCLQFPKQNSTYDRKYSYPTKAIELITNDIFFCNLSWDKQLIHHSLVIMFKYFQTVDPHVNNINIYHGYFQRIFKMFFGSRIIDKLDLIAAILEIQEKQKTILQIMYKHDYKLSIAYCLQIVLTIDCIEPLVTVPQQFKQNIFAHIFQIFQQFLNNGIEIQKAQNSFHILKGFFEKQINFLSINRNEIQKPLNSSKLQIFFEIYQIFHNNFPILTQILLKQTDNSIKILILQIFLLNQILISQPQFQRRQYNSQIYMKNYQIIIQFYLNNKINISTSFFIDWLIIKFSDIGRYQKEIQLFYRLNIIQKIIKLMINNKYNNILCNKIYQFLKIIFYNATQIEPIHIIEKYKNININYIQFILLNYYISSLSILENIVKSFKSINQPLFVTLFNLYKIISQYCKNLDNIFNLYIHIDICKQTKPIIHKIIEFQKNQPCFVIYEREISKDLGKFYNDQMFINQKPIQYVIIPQKIKQKSIQQIQKSSSEEIHSIIQIPLLELTSTSIIPQINTPLQDKSIVNNTSNQIQIIPIKQQKDQNQQDTGRYSLYMAQKLKEVGSNIQMRRSKSKTPTKIKNELKKAKNRWITPQQNIQKQTKNIFNSQIKQKSNKSLTSPKMTKILAQCNLQKIILIRVPKTKIPKKIKERQLNYQRDGRLINWLKILRT